jgi:hypothetical protein
MRRILAASILVFGLAVGGSDARSPQEDPFLTAYYQDNQAVLCRDYQTANGARFATYQWWLLGFVSGAGHVRNAMNRPLAHVEVARAFALASDHCRAKPMDTLASAGIAIVDSLDSVQSGK